MLKLNKKGMHRQTSHIVEIVVGIVIALAILVALAPNIYNGLGTAHGGLGNVSENPSVPTWFPSVLIIVISAGLLFLIWEYFSYKK